MKTLLQMFFNYHSRVDQTPQAQLIVDFRCSIQLAIISLLCFLQIAVKVSLIFSRINYFPPGSVIQQLKSDFLIPWNLLANLERDHGPIHLLIDLQNRESNSLFHRDNNLLIFVTGTDPVKLSVILRSIIEKRVDFQNAAPLVALIEKKNMKHLLINSSGRLGNVHKPAEMNFILKFYSLLSTFPVICNFPFQYQDGLSSVQEMLGCRRCSHNHNFVTYFPSSKLEFKRDGLLKNRNVSNIKLESKIYLSIKCNKLNQVAETKDSLRKWTRLIGNICFFNQTLSSFKASKVSITSNSAHIPIESSINSHRQEYPTSRNLVLPNLSTSGKERIPSLIMTNKKSNNSVFKAVYRNHELVEHIYIEYAIPYFLLQTLSARSLKKLLSKLEQDPSRKLLFINARYGLGNRLRVLASAIHFAKTNNRQIFLIWIPDEHLTAKFGDLFIEPRDLIVGDKKFQTARWPFSFEKKEYKHAMSTVLWYSFMRNELDVGKAPNVIENPGDKHIYISTCYMINYNGSFSKSPIKSLAILKHYLSPVPMIGNFVDNMKQYYNFSNIIGVHIRSRLLSRDIRKLPSRKVRNIYGKKSVLITDGWRNRTKLQKFKKVMKKEGMKRVFYVSSDDNAVPKKLHSEFPGQVLWTDRRCDGREHACLKYAVIDLLLLSECIEIRGSYWSSFTEIAAGIGNKKFLRAGVDFGKD